MSEMNYDGAVDVVKKKPIGAIVGGSVAGLAVVGGLLYAFVPTVQNSVRMTFMKPENYYAWVEKNSAESMTKDFTKQYGTMLSTTNSKDGTASEVSMKIEIDPAIAEQIGMTDLSSIEITGKTQTKDGKAALDAELSMNDSKLVGAKLITDEEGTIYIQLPGLTDSTLKIDEATMQALLEEQGMDMSEVTDMMGGFSMDDLPTEKEVGDLLNTYTNIIFDTVENVTLEKGVECEAVDTESKYSTLTVELNEADAYDILLAYINELQNDSVVQKYAEKYADVTKEDYKEALKDAKDSIKEEKADLDKDELKDNYVEMIVYVDKTGTIRGRSFTVYEDGEKMDDFSLSYLAVQEKDTTAFEMLLNIDGTEMKLEVEDTEKSDKHNGTMNFTAEDIAVGITYKNVETVDEEKGYINGSFTLDVESLATVTLDCKSDGKGQEYVLSAKAAGMQIGTITVSMKEAKSEKIEIPTGDVYSIDDIEAFAETIDTDALLENETIAQLLGAIGLDGRGDYFGDDDYDYDYDWDDDYDYDWDDEDFDFDWDDDDDNTSASSTPLEDNVKLLVSMAQMAVDEFSSDSECFGMIPSDASLDYDVFSGTQEEVNAIRDNIKLITGNDNAWLIYLEDGEVAEACFADSMDSSEVAFYSYGDTEIGDLGQSLKTLIQTIYEGFV